MPETPSFKIREPPAPPVGVTPCDVPYAELDVTSNFSFLRGASHPDELVYTAATLGYRALALTDRCTLAGMVRAHAAARDCGMKLIVGARLTFADDTPDLLVWCPDRAAYGRLCRLLTVGKRRTEKAKCELYLRDFLDHSEGLLAAIAPSPLWDEGSVGPIRAAIERLWNYDIAPLALALAANGSSGSGRIWLAAHLAYGPDDSSQLEQLMRLSRHWRIPLVATNHVHYHHPARRPLQDVLVCIREGVTIDRAGFRLFPNAERYLKPPDQMHRLFAACPSAVAATMEIADRCTFRMDELKYEYPDELVPPGKTAIEYLRELTWAGVRERHGEGRKGLGEQEKGLRDYGTKGLRGQNLLPLSPSVPQSLSPLPLSPFPLPPSVRALIESELALIEQLKFEHYFLTVHDLVRFARSRGILCQGRGSAANSAVCYYLGVTSVEPTQIDLLFERFISAARNEPPDIDIDFEHERREEVIQYLYQKYGRDRAGLAAEVITYRGRSAVREVGKALGLSLDMVDAMARKLDWWHRGVLSDAQLRETGLDPTDATVRRVIALATELLGFPRHLGQHVGGMVMSRGPLCEVAPIENARMEDRTVVEWDKDDLEELGLLKVDVLGLGMLTCISKGFGLIEGLRDYGTEGLRGRRTGASHGTDTPDSNLSRLDRLAEGDGSGPRGLSGDECHARGGTVRAHQPDEAGIGLGAVEHHRGLRAPWTDGLHSLPENGPRLPRRVGDAIRSGNIHADDEAGRRHRQTAPRHRDLVAVAHHKPGAAPPEATHVTLPSLSPPVPQSLSPSVPSSPSPLPRCRLELHIIPPEDPLVYDMICDADTVGVFQIESRAQMSMLPRLRPRCFYDLVIEVAIVRPGPIQGNMVHPYLRRRNGEEAVSYPSEGLRQVLQKTLGVPLFQEQAMRVAMVGAGFSGAEADQLRRAMTAWKRSTKLLHFRDRIITGMLNNGYTRAFAEQCFEQIKGFGEYGFPESHSASFARLVYISAWLKRHHPAAFAAALINSQPMGFYQPAQIVRDAREHGVEVRPVDVNESGWDCSLELPSGDLQSTNRDSQIESRKSEWGRGGPALRLGLRMIKGLRVTDAEKLVSVRERRGGFASVEQFQQATGLKKAVLRRLAEADAFASLGLSRREALWDVMKLSDEEMPLYEGGEKGLRDYGTEGPRGQDLRTFSPSVPQSLNPFLPQMPLGQQVSIDYATVGLSLRAHPLGLLRAALRRERVITAAEMHRLPHGRRARVAGLVLIRQRPGTASGVVFITLEDETGVANLIVRPKVFDRYRAAARHAGLLVCEGLVERQGQVVHVMARQLYDRSDLLGGIEFASRDFH